MKFFSFDEFERSASAQRLNIDNRIPENLKGNVTVLVDAVLDPLREKWGKPITVNSGYRCPALNRAIGGKPTSQHTKGMAADITTGNRADNRRLFQMIMDMKLPYDQLINENGFSWIHVSHRADGENRGQVFAL